MVKISFSTLGTALVTVLGLTSVGCSEVTYEDDTSQANPLDAWESELVGALNDLRTASSVPALKVCASLNTSASKHSDDMRDKNYLDDVAGDGSTPPIRACGAGYTAACEGNIAMSELLAKGNADGKSTLDQWNKDVNTSPVLKDPQFVVVGVGRSLGGEAGIWTLDLAGMDDPSCAGAM